MLVRPEIVRSWSARPEARVRAGFEGGNAAPLDAALRLVADGKSVGWFPVRLGPAPYDLTGADVRVFPVTLGDGLSPSADATRALDALAQPGGLRVETRVSKADEHGRRGALPTAEDLVTTELAGTFSVAMSTLAPALAAFPGLQIVLGGQLSTGHCGDIPPAR